jgi:hypothetical protein
MGRSSQVAAGFTADQSITSETAVTPPRILFVFLSFLVVACSQGTDTGDAGTDEHLGSVTQELCADPPCCRAGTTRCGDDCVVTSNLQTDPDNCGRCGNVCSTGRCAAGRCSCPAGTTNCNNSCENLQTSESSCGACGVRCPYQYSCSAGQCVPAPPMCPDPAASVTPGFPIWNVSLHHNGIPNDNTVVTGAQMIDAVNHIAAVTWNPDDLIVVLPSAPSYFLGMIYSGVDFVDQLRARFPGHTFTYHQTNDMGNALLDSLDGIDHPPWPCTIHPNNSAVIIGSNWHFTSTQNHGDVGNGGNEKHMYSYIANNPVAYCYGQEADYFGDFGIQHNVNGLAMHILTVQTQAANRDTAARQVADIANWGRVWRASVPTFVIGDFNGALLSETQGPALRQLLNIWTQDFVAPPGVPNFALCPGFSGGQTVDTAGHPTGPSFETAMHISGVNQAAALTPVGFRTETAYSFNSAQLILPNIAHSVEVAYFRYP